MIFKKEIADEERVLTKLEWYWGETYKENNRLVTVYHIIPLNLIIRFARKIYWILFFFVNTKDFRYYYEDGWSKGYTEGFKEGCIYELRSNESIFGTLKADLKTINQHIRQEKYERRRFMDKVKKYGIYILCIGLFIAMLIVASSTIGCSASDKIGITEKIITQGLYGEPVEKRVLTIKAEESSDIIADGMPYGFILTLGLSLLGLRRRRKDFSILSEGVNTAMTDNPEMKEKIGISLGKTMDKYKVRERFKKYKDKMLKK